MASGGKKKTTMAKLTRERKLHERRLDKQAKKDARKRASAYASEHPDDPLSPAIDEPAQTEVEHPALALALPDASPSRSSQAD
jgi:hypothetical protein